MAILLTVSIETEKLLRIKPDLAIILCTGFGKRISKQKAAKIGVKKIVLNPLDTNQMANIISTVLDEKDRKQ